MNHFKKLLYVFAFMVLPWHAVAQQSLTLQDAINLALEHNRTLKVSALETSRAQEQVKVAKSRLLPSVDLGGQYAHYFTRPAFFGFGPAAEGETLPYSRIGGDDQFVAAVSLVQPLYAPGLKPDLNSARLVENKSQLTLRHQELELIARVRLTYLGVLVLDERLKLQQESLKRNAKVLDDARLLYLQGRALRVDTLRAFTTVKNLEPDIARLSDAIRTGKLQLRTLVGFDKIEEVSLSDSLFIESIDEVPTEEEVYDQAVNLRPDMQALVLDEKIAHEQISSSKSAKLPTLSLVGQYQVLTQVNDLELGSARWPSVSYAGLQLAIPLYHGNRQVARVREARLGEQQAQLRASEAREQFKVDVRRVVASLHETRARLHTQATVRETAQLTYDMIKYRYQKGVASRLELTDAELALTAAQSAYLESVYDYLAAHIALDRLVAKK